MGKNVFCGFSVGKTINKKGNSTFCMFSLSILTNTDSFDISSNDSNGQQNYRLGISSISTKNLGWKYRGSISKAVGSKDIHHDVTISHDASKLNTSLFLFGQNKNITKQLDIAGSVIAIDKSLFVSSPIYNSFALAKVKDIEGVPIYSNNLIAGVTNKKGNLIIPELQAYTPSEIRLDEDSLPINSTFSTVTVTVAPKNKSGVIANFEITKTKHLEITLLDAEGKELSPDTTITVEGINEDLFIGYDSILYINDVKDLKHLKGQAQLEGGKTCAFTIDVPNTTEDTIKDVGQIRCR